MNIKALASLLIALLFLVVFFYLVPPEELFSSLKRVSLVEVAFGFVLYTLSQITRSLRWVLLLRGLNLKEAFLINSANIFLNNLLPARTGELSWFYYAKRLGHDLKSSLWSFFMGRAYDILGMFSLLLLSYTLALHPLITPLSFAGLLLLSGMLSKAYAVVPPLGRLSGLREFLRRELSVPLSLKLFALSTLSFTLKAISVYVITYKLLSIGFFKFSLAFAGGELTTVLPLHGFMGYGTYEAGFLLLLKQGGIEVKEALKAGFLVHSFLLLSSAVWGALSIWLLHTLARKSP